MKSLYKSKRVLITLPLIIPHVILYKLSSNKQVIDSDIIAWGKYRPRFVNPEELTSSLINLLVYQRDFRQVFCFRLGRISRLLFYFNGSRVNCELNNNKNIGKGFVLIHGECTRISVMATIGDDCTIMHLVTIGNSYNGAPTIGNNVFIGVGAKVIGGVKIGNNVKIGAGTVVVKDVPDNTTVVSAPVRYITHNPEEKQHDLFQKDPTLLK